MLSHIKRIEIELHSYCNRKCPWCPNKDLDRQFYKEMPEDLYLKILNELKEGNFGIHCNTFATYQPTIITFNRFSEPMYNPSLLKKRVGQARSLLGRVLYAANTNGDFLTAENLDGLILDSLLVMDYDCIGREAAIKKLEMCNALVLGDHMGVLVGAHKSVTRIDYYYDWPLRAELEDRAGFLRDEIDFNGARIKWKNDRKARTYPCIEPANYVSIDHEGNVTPCCHIRADYEPHAPYVFGNLRDRTLIEILNSKEWIGFQSLVGSNEYAKYPETCKHCHKAR